MSDPVAEKSAFLRMYMSSHPDTLVAYAKWYGKVTAPISSAEMTSIDSNAMLLTCTMKSGAKQEVHVPIVPPLKGYDDVKPRLLEMKAIAQEKLGMIKTPRITSFRFPSDAIAPGIFVGTLLYLFLAPKDGSSALFEPARYVDTTFGPLPVKVAVYITAVAHICFFTGTAYVMSTLVFGLPIWKDFRKRVQAARIDSVMKVE
ncbi:putative protein with domain of unknown function (DUF4499) [Lyophyllum shimeji]|uniref:DUF2470 domain-containing protein n=1 Tax=Lyophyllum shimeji TaxID=47721 RepID=A0A9P3UMV7_LYOSH|nr:putative protein with domain of unknown function (DUF4499) [Lyophyllum shimeji]